MTDPNRDIEVVLDDTDIENVYGELLKYTLLKFLETIHF